MSSSRASMPGSLSKKRASRSTATNLSLRPDAVAQPTRDRATTGAYVEAPPSRSNSQLGEPCRCGGGVAAPDQLRPAAALTPPRLESILPPRAKLPPGGTPPHPPPRARQPPPTPHYNS